MCIYRPLKLLKGQRGNKMNQVFLSHSSKDKFYVGLVAANLRKSYVVYDEWTFEAGGKTIEEIFDGLEASGIFVLFISKASLDSPWVQTEIHIAEDFLEKGKMHRFLAFIVDDSIAHANQKIPLWLRENYNLQYISKPSKTSEIIRQNFRQLLWDQYPKNKELDSLFIGRTDLVRIFEERIFNPSQSIPTTIIVSGLQSIGRRTFINHCLRKTKKIRPAYEPPIIAIDNRSSIENFILQLHALGLDNMDNIAILNCINDTLKNKIEIAIKLLDQLNKTKETLFIIDDFSIVGVDGIISEWFLSIQKSLNHLDRISLCVISHSRVYQSYKYNNNNLFTISVPELEPYERSALFQSLLDIEEIDLPREEVQSVSNLFTGLPSQVFYTVAIIKSEGILYLKKHTSEVLDFNSEYASYILQQLFQDEATTQVLALLSIYEFVSYGLVEIVIGPFTNKLPDIINDLNNRMVIEWIGNSKEYMRLNHVFMNHVQRSGYKLNSTCKTALEDHAKEQINNPEVLDYDVSDYLLSYREAIKEGYEVNLDFLIPSVYVNAMRELYHKERRYNSVIDLAKKALQNSVNLEENIIGELKYWLCLSLARLKDRNMLQEVQYFKGYKHHFLLGFYYRKMGRYNDAVNEFKKVLLEKSNDKTAKRELVESYINLYEFEEAYNLARENFLSDRSNPFHIQSYFRCLMFRPEPPQVEMEWLLECLNSCEHERAREMYLTSSAQYYAFVKNDEENAINQCDDAISSFPSSIYPHLTKLDILDKYNRYESISSVLNAIEVTFKSRVSEFHNKLPYLKAQILSKVYINDNNRATMLLNEKIKNRFSPRIYDAINAKIRYNK